MLRNNNKYGVLSRNLETWFFMVEERTMDGAKAHVLNISNVVEIDNPMPQLFKIYHLAKERTIWSDNRYIFI